MKKKIGIVGCGMIGSCIAKAIKEKYSNKAELTAVFDLEKEKAEKLGKVLPLDQLIDSVDLVVEAASPKVVKELVPMVLAKKKEILVVSTGGLLGMKIEEGMYLTNGAIAGLDGLRAAKCGRLDKVTLTTTKPPRALGDKEYTEDTVVFSGSVDQAIEKFPKNINVSATLAVVAGDPKLVTVKIVASPKVDRNIHKVDIEGDFGHITYIFKNEPSPFNPKTSYLAILSTIAKLGEILDG